MPGLRIKHHKISKKYPKLMPGLRIKHHKISKINAETKDNSLYRCFIPMTIFTLTVVIQNI